MATSRVSRKKFVASCGSAIAAAGTAAFAASAPYVYANLAALRDHRSTIRAVRVYSLNPNISTLIAVTPASLETFDGVRVRTHADRKTIDATLAGLARASAAVTEQHPFDARWALVYEDGSGARLLAIYANARASRGMLGRHNVVFNDPMPLLAALRNASR